MIIFVEIGKYICKSCSCLIYSSMASRLYPLYYVLFYYNVFVNFSLKLDSFLHLKYQQVIFSTLIIPISSSYPSTLIMKIFCFDHSFSYIYYQFSQFVSLVFLFTITSIPAPKYVFLGMTTMPVLVQKENEPVKFIYLNILIVNIFKQIRQ